jgi:hypothetical protein
VAFVELLGLRVAYFVVVGFISLLLQSYFVVYAPYFVVCGK